MTTTTRRRRLRQHDLLDDHSDDGYSSSCTCGWWSRPRLDELDARYDGDEHLGLVAFRRLQMSGVIPAVAMRRGRAPSGMWAALAAHRERLDDGAQAVLDVVTATWPERVGR